jgi:hypothetical protein
MEDKMIMIGVGARPEGEPMSEDLGMAEEADAEMFEAMAPRGDFTSRGLDPLVRSTNKLLPLFDQTGDYPSVEDTEVLPTDFVRILAMFQAAVEDAIAADVVREEMRIDLDGVRDDTALMTIAGKLDMLAKDREFKKFLQEPLEEDEELETEMTEEEPMSDDEMDSLMMERM